jgi:hypothetical protein
MDVNAWLTYAWDASRRVGRHQVRTAMLRGFQLPFGGLTIAASKPFGIECPYGNVPVSEDGG